MKHTEQERGYQGGYLIGFIIIAAVSLRAIINFQSSPPLILAITLLVLFTIMYSLEPWLASHFSWQKYLYFPVQTGFVMLLTSLHPFSDISCLLYIPLSIQIFRSFSLRTAGIWSFFYLFLLTLTLILGLGWLVGLALVLLFLAVCSFLVSYDFLFLRTQTEQAQSQQLLGELQAPKSTA